MIIIKASKEATQEMKDWFDERTNKHIKLVQDYCKKIDEAFPGRFPNLVERGKEHDKSKFGNPEYDPYIWTTWRYKCKEDGKKFDPPEGMEDKMNEATEHHIKNNRHHPEFHCDKEENLINEDNRDKPPEDAIDATKMEDEDIAEMCADWCSTSEERGNSPRNWADKNIGPRWKFDDDQKELIYEIIDAVWE